MNALSRQVSIFAVVVAVSVLAGCDRLETWLYPEQCALSGRPIHAGMGVRIQIDEKAPVRACCLRCAIAESRHTGQTIRVLSVTDNVSHEQVSPGNALYVVDSGVKPCAGPPIDVSASRREASEQTWDRCLPSVIAFGDREDAERFQKEAGGAIRTFADLVAGTNVTAKE